METCWVGLLRQDPTKCDCNHVILQLQAPQFFRIRKILDHVGAGPLLRGIGGNRHSRELLLFFYHFAS